MNKNNCPITAKTMDSNNWLNGKLVLYFGTLRVIFKPFYELFCFNNHKATFTQKNFNCSLNHIYLLTD